MTWSVSYFVTRDGLETSCIDLLTLWSSVFKVTMLWCSFIGLQATQIFQDGHQTEDPCGDPDINDYFQQPMQQQEIQHPDSQQAASQLYTNSEENSWAVKGTVLYSGAAMWLRWSCWQNIGDTKRYLKTSTPWVFGNAGINFFLKHLSDKELFWHLIKREKAFSVLFIKEIRRCIKINVTGGKDTWKDTWNK